VRRARGSARRARYLSPLPPCEPEMSETARRGAAQHVPPSCRRRLSSLHTSIHFPLQPRPSPRHPPPRPRPRPRLPRLQVRRVRGAGRTQRGGRTRCATWPLTPPRARANRRRARRLTAALPSTRPLPSSLSSPSLHFFPLFSSAPPSPPPSPPAPARSARHRRSSGARRTQEGAHCTVPHSGRCLEQ
jgi:hypothetical protein